MAGGCAYVGIARGGRRGRQCRRCGYKGGEVRRSRARAVLKLPRAAIDAVEGSGTCDEEGVERKNEEEEEDAFLTGFGARSEVRLMCKGVAEEWGAMRYKSTAAKDGSGATLEVRVAKKGARDAATAEAAAGSCEDAPLIVRWAVSRRVGGSWRACPYGWRSEPPKSWDSGDGSSWETEMKVDEPGKYSASFFIPFDDARSLRCVVLVLRTVTYEWLKDADVSDVYIQLPVGDDTPQRGNDAERGASLNDAERGASLDEAAPEPLPHMHHSWINFAVDGGQLSCDGDGESPHIASEIAAAEPDSERSLMHRYSNAAHLVSSNGESRNALLSILVWLRLTAARELVWNRNYNVKPREIAVKQELCGRAVASLFGRGMDVELLRLLVAAVGRGGSSEAGQRIRDEILHIQRNSDCKGGMMEEWHQKLHNNTSPDDVVICEALLAYIDGGRSLDAYWGHLNANGVTAERMKSYDRPIHSEPSFNDHQANSLRHDLREYLATLRAVHDGDDLSAAAAAVLGYERSRERGVAVVQGAVGGVVTDYLRDVLAYIQHSLSAGPPRDVGGDTVGWLLGVFTAITDCRAHLFPSLQSTRSLGDRALDVVVLDVALDSAARRQCEQMLGDIRGAGVKRQLEVLRLLLRSVILSSGSNRVFIECLADVESVLSRAEGGDDDALDDALKEAAAKALVKAMAEVGSRSEATMHALDGAARLVTRELNVRPEAEEEIKESITRGGTAAVMAQVMGSLQPELRTSNSGTWSVVSRGPDGAVRCPVGRVAVVASISDIATKEFEEPTVLVVDGRVSGDEDIPAGVVAIFTKSTIDILCHLAVRARTERVLVGLVADPRSDAPLRELSQREGDFVRVTVGANAVDAFIERASDVDIGEALAASRERASFLSSLRLQLAPKTWCGKYMLSRERAWKSDTVGAKALNLKHLRAALPSDVSIPRGVAIPYGSCEAAVADDANEKAHAALSALESCNKDALETAQEAVDIVSGLEPPRTFLETMDVLLGVERPPPRTLSQPLLEKMGALFGGDADAPSFASVVGGDAAADVRTELWRSVKGVWTSKWNQRAILACRKAALEHRHVFMSVLVQEAIDAQYAFVVHTRHPVTNSADDLYCELVAGLGETLVGNYAGNALAFTVHKPTMSASVDKYPTKAVALKLDRPTLICRSDSNCEDLPGFAGAGLFDSVFVAEPAEVAHDYGSDRIVCDPAFRDRYCRAIAETCLKVEAAFGGCAQDIEGVIDAEGKIYIVQARPQM